MPAKVFLYAPAPEKVLARHRLRPSNQPIVRATGGFVLHFRMSDAPILDPESIENLRALGSEGDDSFLKEIIGIFIEDTPQRIQEMRTAFAAGDQPTFSRAAHSIKGSASNLGALRLGAVAEKLEHTSKQQGITGLDQMIPMLEAEFETARAELAKL